MHALLDAPPWRPIIHEEIHEAPDHPRARGDERFGVFATPLAERVRRDVDVW